MSEALAREWEELIAQLQGEVVGLNQGRMTATGDAPPPDDDEPF